MAVLLLASSLTSGDVSHTVKGVHKHTFLVYTESKDQERRQKHDETSCETTNPKEIVASTNDSSQNDEDDDYYEETLGGENDERQR
ncbi:hypothetical protein CEXT_377451 [Caerostris extrusa]|uniref:Uncharacterized protein n=1 Tax=Caerostris extrusa TaxID=172846 RepID=A0AAV4Y887_CAEEX|nr:hypothetical protein CEXT_377451 [Caerostris extrusa]